MLIQIIRKRIRNDINVYFVNLQYTNIHTHIVRTIESEYMQL